MAPEVTRRLLAAFARSPEHVEPEMPDDVAGLTDREREVLAGLGRGLSNAALAHELAISEATARTHVSRVLAKLGCTSRVQAAIRARDAGLAREIPARRTGRGATCGDGRGLRPAGP